MKRNIGVTFHFMKHICIILSVICLLSLPMKSYATEAASVVAVSGEVKVTSDVNVRQGPGTTYEILGTIRTGDVLAVTGKTSDNWYQILFQSETGYVYGDYVSFTEKEEAGVSPDDLPNMTEDESEAESVGITKWIKPIAIALMMIVIAIMMVLTIRSMRQMDDEESESDDEDDDFEDDDFEDDEFDDEELYEDEDEDSDEDFEDEEYNEESKNIPQKTTTTSDHFILREEDYQLHIDPKYFEDDPVPQPDCVTGYLKKKQEEEAKLAESKTGGNTADIERAMNKLQELQEELEKLKKNQ